ncbi:MAG: PIN domain-containing protein [Chloroflexota bacterium]
MPPNQILADSSFLIALYNKDDPLHKRATSGIDFDIDILVPQVTLVEVTYLLAERAGVPTSILFLSKIIESQIPLLPLESVDLIRARDIMATYADNRFDFVDCCIMALAERLNITKIYTFDRRDFRVFRPTHCDYLELLP